MGRTANERHFEYVTSEFGQIKYALTCSYRSLRLSGVSSATLVTCLVWWHDICHIGHTANGTGQRFPKTDEGLPDICCARSLCQFYPAARIRTYDGEVTFATSQADLSDISIGLVYRLCTAKC